MRTDTTPSRHPAAVSANLPSYVLITPARNEAQFIGLTIRAVVAQTIRPLRWVIVSDGSTDGTDEIVRRHAEVYPWIQLLRMPPRRERHFAAKVYAFKAGYARLAPLRFDVVGNLDADITFDPDYFQFLMQRFAQDPRLGVGGTPFKDSSRQHNYDLVSVEHVSGACQLFRRECFEEIGGYTPIKTGGIDLVAVMTARMKGWQTRSFPQKTCVHHRKQGSATHGTLAYAFKDGRSDYALGCGPVWQVMRCTRRLIRVRPLVLGGAVCLAGFFWAMLCRAERAVPPELVRFRRHEEWRRLRDLAQRALGRLAADPTHGSVHPVSQAHRSES